MNYGEREKTSPNARGLLFCEFSLVKVLALAERKLQNPGM
jgi:hypothetical protein